MDDDDLPGVELVEMRRRLHGAAGIVHVGLGLQQHDLLAGDLAFGDEAVEAAAPGPEAMAADDRVHRHEADIVPVARRSPGPDCRGRR